MNEYAKFQKWFFSKYGKLAKEIGWNENNFKQFPDYSLWVNAGRPTQAVRKVPLTMGPAPDWVPRVGTPEFKDWTAAGRPQLGAETPSAAPPDSMKGAQLVTPTLMLLADGTYWDMETEKTVSPQMAQRLLSAFYGTDEPRQIDQGITAFQQAQLDIQWAQIEEQRAQREREWLVSLSGERDWIKRWFAENIPRQQQTDGAEAAAQARFFTPAGRAAEFERLMGVQLNPWGEFANISQAVQAAGAEEALAAASWASQQANIGVPPSEATFLGGLGSSAPLREGTIGHTAAELAAGAHQPGGARPLTAPPTPPWLAQILPQLTVGKPIRPLPVPTPSMQQYATMPESVRQGLAGFVDWAAGTPGAPAGWGDVLSRMEMMQPGTPSRPRGWGLQRRFV